MSGIAGWTRGGRWTRWVVDVLPIVAIAVVVFHLIRNHLLEHYRVPSQSMEPTIHGDRRHGDLVLVDKTAWWSASPGAFDLVVVRGATPRDNNIVKRCVAIGPAQLRIHGGDLYRADSRGVFPALPVGKDPIVHRDMRIPVFRHAAHRSSGGSSDGSAHEAGDVGPCEQSLEEFFRLPPEIARVTEDGALELAAASPDVAGFLLRLDPAARQPAQGELAPAIDGLVSTNKAVDTSYLSPTGRRQWTGLNYYADIGVSLGLRVDDDVQCVLFVLEYRDRDYGLFWERNGHVSLVVAGAVQQRVKAAPWAADRLAVSFGYLDGRLFLTSGEHKVFHEPVALDPNENYRRPNALHFGVTGGSGVVDRVIVFHDVPVTASAGRHSNGSGIYRVETGNMFLLGDNAHDSSDSRGSLGGVPLSHLVGRPLAILAPASRARFFVR